ncbi:MAG TPA: hypothetical protein VLM83_09665 [Anaerolineales bacterium]|nr:hypothetical protein [Anaerolineales bacterium]
MRFREFETRIRALPAFNKMGVSSPEGLRQEMLSKMETLDFDALAADVAPFLISKEQVRRVVKFREFWKQVEMD